MPAGSTATYTVTLKVPSSRTGTVTTITSIAAPAGVTDLVDENNSAHDTDLKLGDFDLQITNTDDKPDYTPGLATTYTVTATNNGPSDVSGARVTYTLPAGVTGAWTAVYAGAATGTLSGTGDINETVNMPAGSVITYTVTINIPGSRTVY